MNATSTAGVSRRVRFTAWLLPIVIGTMAAALPARADHAKLRGQWYDDGSPCLIPTGGRLGPGVPPETISFGCIGGSIYDGDLIGHTVYTAWGTVNLETGDVHATAEQWFTGVYARDGGFGTLHFRSVVDANLSTGEFRDWSVILGGTFSFAGSRGWLDFTGLPLTRGLAGSYVGSLARPARNWDAATG